MEGFRSRSPLVVVVMGDYEVLVRVFVRRVFDTIRKSEWVNDLTSNVLKGGTRVLNDFLSLFNLDFDRG